jgi:predicted transcriptional regulator
VQAMTQETKKEKGLKFMSAAYIRVTRAGVDVMITIFSDFRQFLAKKLAFLFKKNVVNKCLHNLALFM